MALKPGSGWSLAKRLRATVHMLIRRTVWRQQIGEGTLIDPSALIDRTWPKGIHIGRGCYIAEEAVVLSHDFTRGVYLDTHIGDRCILAQRSIVLPGLTVGNDCIVMPGALLTRDMPPNSIASGNPATIEPRCLPGQSPS